MSLLENRRFQISISSSLFLVVIAYGTWQYLYTHDRERLGYSKPLPPGGVADFDTKGLVPGDPRNGERSLKHLYTLVETYRHLHGTMQPSIISDLLEDTMRHPKQYGFESVAALDAYLANPDSRFTDNNINKENPQANGFCSVRVRPDGTLPFTDKTPGTHDIIAYQTTYLHMNRRNFSGQRTTMNPVGFYQVLWDDGQVQKVAYDQIKTVLHGKPSRYNYGEFAFPGQSGVPADALTYDQFYAKAGWIKGPRGEEGGKGVAYNGQSYR